MLPCGSAPQPVEVTRSFEQTALAVPRFKQKRAVKQSWTSPVVQITLILIVIAVDTESAVAKLDTRDNGVVAGFFAAFRWSVGVDRISVEKVTVMVAAPQPNPRSPSGPAPIRLCAR